jgi:hypothetical protein
MGGGRRYVDALTLDNGTDPQVQFTPNVNGAALDRALALGGPISMPVQSIAGDITLGETVYYAFLDATGAVRSANLPASSSVPQGRTYLVVKTDGSANAVNLVPTGGDIVAGTSSLTNQNEAVLITLDGTTWRTVAMGASGGGGAGTWAATLSLGNTSGGTDAVMSPGATQEANDALRGAAGVGPSAIGRGVLLHGGNGDVPYGYRGPAIVGTDPIGGGYGWTLPGNNRGGQAIDLQGSRYSATQVAAGTQAFLFPGMNNRLDHVRSAMGGFGNDFQTGGYYLYGTYGRDNFIWGAFNSAGTTVDYWTHNIVHSRYSSFDATQGYLNHFHVQSFGTTGAYNYPYLYGNTIHGTSPDFYGWMESRFSQINGIGAYFGGQQTYNNITAVGFGSVVGTYGRSGAGRSAVETSLIMVANSEIAAEAGNDLTNSLVVGEAGKTGATLGTNANKAINGAVVTGDGFHAVQSHQEVHSATSGTGTRSQATRTPLVAVTSAQAQSAVLTATGAAASAVAAIANVIRHNIAHGFRMVIVARQENTDGGGGVAGDCAMFEISGLLSNSGVAPGTVTVHGQAPVNPVSPAFTNGGASMGALTVSLGGAADVFTVTVASNYGGGGTLPTIRWMAYIIGPHVGDDSQ